MTSWKNASITPAYFSRVGIPSIMSADGSGNHKYQPFEQDANRRAFLYFNDPKNKVEGFYKSQGDFQRLGNNSVGWDFRSNPLNIYGTGNRNEYVDYRNNDHRQLLNALSLKAKWYDYASWLLFPIGPIGVGLINAR